METGEAQRARGSAEGRARPLLHPHRPRPRPLSRSPPVLRCSAASRGSPVPQPTDRGSPVRPPRPPTPVPALTGKDGEPQAETEDDRVSVEGQLSQWRRGQRVPEGHQPQRAGPEAAGHVNDLRAGGVARGRRTTVWPGRALAVPLRCWGPGTELAGMQDVPGRGGDVGVRGRGHELAPTLYPEALTCSPLLVRVDFMRMKNERSWTPEEGDPSAGLASGGRARAVVGSPRGSTQAALPPRRASQKRGQLSCSATNSLTLSTNPRSQQQPASRVFLKLGPDLVPPLL